MVSSKDAWRRHRYMIVYSYMMMQRRLDFRVALIISNVK